MLLVPKSVPQQAIKNCGAAFQRFFKKQGRYPKFKLSTTVRRVADRWFVCVPVEVELPEPAPENQAVGIDLGVSTAATHSDGEKLPARGEESLLLRSR